MPIAGYSAVKVFTSSNNRDRAELGESLSSWLAAHPDVEVVHRVVVQSSDRTHHAFSIVLFLVRATEGRG